MSTSVPFYIHASPETLPKNAEPKKFSLPSSSFSDHYAKLYKNPDHSDVEIAINQTIFPCYRSILSAWSPVFDTMFKKKSTGYSYAESSQNRIVLKESDPSTFDTVLQFIFLGSADLSADNFAELHKLPDLKARCVDFITSYFGALRRADELMQISATQLIDII